ncbi:MAG: VCBS repeat-containing protein [Planctomycetota bacterium]
MLTLALTSLVPLLQAGVPRGPLTDAGPIRPVPVDGAEPLLDAAVVRFPPHSRVEFLTDFNLDGIPDAVSLFPRVPTFNTRGWILDGFAGDGRGGFSESWSIRIDERDPDVAFSVKLADVDGVPPLDYVGIVDNEFFSITHTPGSVQPIERQTSNVAGYVLGVTDVNGDGLDDVVVRRGLELVLFVNQGAAGGFQYVEADARTMLWPSTAANPRDMKLAEMTGDGVLDVVVVTTEGLEVWPMAVAGFAATPVLLDADWGASFYVGASSGDLDGDDDTDFVVFTRQPFAYRIFRRTGPQSFDLEDFAAGGPATDLADVDGDGDLDGVCCGGGGGSTSYPENWDKSSFEVALNDGTGALARAFRIPGVGAQHIGGVADVDLDGDQDLVGGRAVYFARGSLAESAYGQYAVEHAEVRSVLDYDLDGDVDLGFDTRGVASSDGTGRFVHRSFELPTFPSGEGFRGGGYVGDWNGDGRPDLIVAHEISGVFLSMRLLAGGAGDRFSDAGPAGPPGSVIGYRGDAPDPVHGMGRDVDGDGDLDLIVPVLGHSPPSSEVWWNDGSGFFAAGTLFPSVIDVADLDGDGHVDLLHYYSDRLFMSRSTGPGAFEATTRTVADNVELHNGFAIADIDRDGNLDVIAGDGGSVRVFTNEIASGSPLFVETTYDGGGGSNSSANPHSALLADFDGDGNPDVLSTSAVRDTGFAQVWLGDSAGALSDSTELFCLYNVRPIAARDVDGDGDSDLIAGTSVVVGALGFSVSIVIENGAIGGLNAGSRRQYGEGAPGAAGIAPKLGATGPFRTGGTCSFHVRGGLGGASGFITVGYRDQTLVAHPGPGLTTYNGGWFRALPFQLSGPAGVPGVGSHDLTFPIGSGHTGRTEYLEAWIVDPAGPMGFSHSNGLAVRFR